MFGFYTLSKPITYLLPASQPANQPANQPSQPTSQPASQPAQPAQPANQPASQPAQPAPPSPTHQPTNPTSPPAHRGGECFYGRKWEKTGGGPRVSPVFKNIVFYRCFLSHFFIVKYGASAIWGQKNAFGCGGVRGCGIRGVSERFSSCFYAISDPQKHRVLPVFF